MKQLYFIISSLLILLSACGKTSSSYQKPVLAVSIEPQKAILEELVGDNFKVVALMPAGANPESYEPSMMQRKEVSDAKAYFTIGYLAFEKALAQKLVGDAVHNTSEGIEVVTGTHVHCSGEADDHHHDHDEADPHVWTSYRNGKIIAKNMLDELLRIDPDNYPLYAARYESMAQRLDSLDNAAAAQLAQSGAHAFCVWHPSLSYFARDYGLHQISVGQESKEMSIGTLKDVIEEAKEDSVKVFFFQKEYDSRQAQSINGEIGSQLVTINPLSARWEEELQLIVNSLVNQQ